MNKTAIYASMSHIRIRKNQGRKEKTQRCRYRLLTPGYNNTFFCLRLSYSFIVLYIRGGLTMQLK